MFQKFGVVLPHLCSILERLNSTFCEAAPANETTMNSVLFSYFDLQDCMKQSVAIFTYT